MDLQKKSVKFGIAGIVVLIAAGILLMYTGNDAVALALEKKEGILTAEQVKVSFDSVSGRIVSENVKEAQEVKKGDVLMVLDSKDVDLSIEKTKAQIAQMDAQIRSTSGAIDIGYAKADTNESQSFSQIDQQRAAISSAEATYHNAQLDYNRKNELYAQGAIARAQLDDAEAKLRVASASVEQQRQGLQRLLGGAADNGSNTVLPTIAEARQELGNKKNDVESMRQQKKMLEVQLAELELKKERLTLRAPEDGKVLKILSKQGEMVSANTPVILLESKRLYYDIYLSETDIANISEGDTITGYTVAGRKELEGTIRYITQAPGFADLKMSREKGQADLTAYQVRIYVDAQDGIKAGMTVGVHDDQFTKG